MTPTMNYPRNKAELYPLLLNQIDALIDGRRHAVSTLANAAALIYEALGDVNWAGFYHMEQGRLVLGPFQGKPACIEIPLNKGVCGAAASRGETVLVKNVHEFPGHIACDSASNSEIVIPIRKKGAVVGVLDIDSPSIGRFTEDDKEGLERFVKILERELFY